MIVVPVGLAGRVPDDRVVSRPLRRAFEFVSGLEARRVADALRTEAVGGVLLLGGAVLALIFANSPLRHFYSELSSHPLGGSALGLHLRLSLSGWASDGLLAIFFFVAGLELKREFVTGELRDPRQAVLPVVAAACGVAVPAVLFLLVSFSSPGASRGWAIPTATDIAFALAVLGIVGSHLPASLRAFLLTLAVVDDLIAIAIIAIVYTSSVSFGYLLGAFIPLAIFAFLSRLGLRPVVLVPLLVLCAVVCWAFVHESGVHATVAGVLLGLVVRVRAGDPFAGQVEHVVRPVSAGFAVPVFAFFASGVALSAMPSAVRDPVAIGVVLGLVVGKTIGVFGGTWLTARFTRASLAPDLRWWDVFGVSVLAGVGFTVSLLIGELAFGPGSARDDDVKIAVLVASVLAAALATGALRSRPRR
ncbi:MAG: Na(+)/H(+) antiporter NhaA [Pseudonocardiales bacterium]|nr:Na(+)/H(+) antiporter NhaA [Pseudonocardiales bacterium]